MEGKSHCWDFAGLFPHKRAKLLSFGSDSWHLWDQHIPFNIYVFLMCHVGAWFGFNMQKIATLCFSQFVVILYSPLYYPNEGTGQKSHPFCWFYCSETNICFPVANDGHDGHNDSDGATFTSAVSRHLMSEAEKRNIYRKCVLIFSPMSGGGRVVLQSVQNLNTVSISSCLFVSLCLFISYVITHYLCLLAIFVVFRKQSHRTAF